MNYNHIQEHIENCKKSNQQDKIYPYCLGAILSIIKSDHFNMTDQEKLVKIKEIVSYI